MNSTRTRTPGSHRTSRGARRSLPNTAAADGKAILEGSPAGMGWNGLPLDWLLLVPALCLAGLGLVMVTSASLPVAAVRMDDPFHFVTRQGVFLLLATALALTLVRVPLRWWQRLEWPLLLLALGLLVLVLIPGIGKEVNGARRWLDLGPVNLQVGEAAKLMLVIYVGGYLARHGARVSTWSGFLRPVAVLMVAALLLLLQPDLGSAAVVLATGMGVLFIAGARLSQFAILGLVAATGAFALVLTTPFRWDRLLCFLNPWRDPVDDCYQLVQALIAVGQGGLSGTGLGLGIQKLSYLPEAHTDFIVAIIGEELGLLGMLALLVLYGLLVWRSFRIGALALQQERVFSAHVAYGVGLLIGIQAVVSIAVNLGLLPTKGLALPLVSYGGSSLLATAAGIALLLRIHGECAQPAGERRLSTRVIRHA